MIAFLFPFVIYLLTLPRICIFKRSEVKNICLNSTGSCPSSTANQFLCALKKHGLMNDFCTQKSREFFKAITARFQICNSVRGEFVIWIFLLEANAAVSSNRVNEFFEYRQLDYQMRKLTLPKSHRLPVTFSSLIPTFREKLSYVFGCSLVTLKPRGIHFNPSIVAPKWQKNLRPLDQKHGYYHHRIIRYFSELVSLWTFSREMKWQEDGENYIMRSFITCTLLQA
jgi:hypothetical protein